MAIGFKAKDIYEGREQPYEKYIDRYAKVGVRDMGIVEGTVLGVKKNLMTISKNNGQSTIIVNIEEISLFEPKELIIISRK